MLTFDCAKAFLTVLTVVLLVAASITPSDARSHHKRSNPPQSEPYYHHLNYNIDARDRDNSCFRSLPAQFACSTN
jgi:hypothetical protein